MAVADLLAVPPGTVKSRTFYGLKALREALIEAGRVLVDGHDLRGVQQEALEALRLSLLGILLIGLPSLSGLAIGATAIQVFTKTPNQWREPTLGAGICAAFRRAVEKSGLRAVISHDSYLINLATTNEEFHRKSIAALVDELDRARRARRRARAPAGRGTPTPSTRPSPRPPPRSVRWTPWCPQPVVSRSRASWSRHSVASMRQAAPISSSARRKLLGVRKRRHSSTGCTRRRTRRQRNRLKRWSRCRGPCRPAQA